MTPTENNKHRSPINGDKTLYDIIVNKEEVKEELKGGSLIDYNERYVLVATEVNNVIVRGYFKGVNVPQWLEKFL